jgi:hypothetical protein
MKAWTTVLVLGVCACVAPLVAAREGRPVRDRDRDRDRNRDREHSRPWDSGMDVQETEQVQRSFTMNGAGPWRLSIDNITGSIRVATGDQQTIELSVTKVIAARTADYVDTARKEVTLDVDESSTGVDLFVDGPFRCQCDSGGCAGGTSARGNCRGGCINGNGCWDNSRTRDWDRNYRVRYDFVLKVPKTTALCLKTVTDGDIRVDGASADFDISNVNGAIEMLDVTGSGRARTINRDVKVVFATNPTKESSFATLNGNTIVYFQPELAANLRVKTFNGKIYTDFDTAHLAGLAPVAERRDGKFIYRSDRGTGLRVGPGGPELRFETLNGDIRILQRD